MGGASRDIFKWADERFVFGRSSSSGSMSTSFLYLFSSSKGWKCGVVAPRRSAHVQMCFRLRVDTVSAVTCTDKQTKQLTAPTLNISQQLSLSRIDEQPERRVGLLGI